VQVRAANLLEPLEPDPVQDARNLRLYAFAALGRGNRSEAETFARSLELALNRAREERRKAGDEAEAKAKREKRDRKAVSTAMADALAGKSRPVEVTEAMLNQVRLELALTTGDIARARELADNLSEVPPDWVPRVWLRIGDFKKAEETARKAVSDNPGTVAPLASLVEVLWKAGKKDDAKTHFQTLRQLAAEAELWRPKLARLQPLALELGWPKDWRLARFHPRDAGIRPALDDLGPALWEPQLAPSFTLQDTTGKARTLAEFAGKPVVVLFYLGSGCAHCIEQLNAFAPFTKRFSEAGIELVAVSTDSAHNLNETFAKATDPGGFTFTVVGDPTLDAFKRYLAYDDLEQKALHGAYLIDAQGRVRWQEIGTAPFNEPEWLLGEARRLLGAPNSGKVAGTSTNL
jgi:peroxiredoxin